MKDDDLGQSNIELALAREAFVECLLRALGLKDKETEGHSLRVAELSLLLARAMGVGDEQLVHVRRGALLHDIGKLGVPDAILFKPGPLSEQEWQVMRQHSHHGYSLLAPIHFLAPALDIVYDHHENWDGSGYPRGLKGEEIPLTARLVALANVWDALAADHPFRPAWSRKDATAYIRDRAGKQFDPQAVKAFLAVIGGLSP